MMEDAISTAHGTFACLQRCLPSNSSQKQQQSVSLEDTEAYIQALDGQTWDVATRNKLQYVETPDEYKLRQDGSLQTVQDTLRSYAHGSMPAADTPNSFLLAVGNPVGSTTSSISEVKHGETPGAIEYFKSATDMQSSAFDCFKQLTDTSRALDAVERDRLESSWRATTGQPCPAVLGSIQDVPLRTELQELAGVTRLYSGQMNTTYFGDAGHLLHP